MTTDRFYNVGTGKRTSLKEVAEKLLDLTGSNQEIHMRRAARRPWCAIALVRRSVRRRRSVYGADRARRRSAPADRVAPQPHRGSRAAPRALAGLALPSQI